MEAENIFGKGTKVISKQRHINMIVAKGALVAGVHIDHLVAALAL